MHLLYHTHMCVDTHIELLTVGQATCYNSVIRGEGNELCQIAVDSNSASTTDWLRDGTLDK